MKNILVIAAIVSFLFLAFGNSPEAANVYTIDKIKIKLPDEYSVSDVPWIPNDPLIQTNGKAFKGCWTNGNTAIPNCIFPSNVKGGVVLPKEWFRSASYKNLANGSFHYAVMHAKDSLFEANDTGTLVSVSNSRLDVSWYVWRKANPLQDNKNIVLEQDDEMLIRCSKDEIVLKGGQTREAITCARELLTPDFALKYSFESNERIPSNIEELDKEVIRQINTWRIE